MEKIRALGAAAAVVAIATMAAAPLWAQDAAPGEILFVNDSSYIVTIVVDGAQVCVVNPGSTCSTRVSTATSDPAQDDADHPVHFASNMGDTYDDSFQVNECDGNRDGVKTYYISDDWIDFDCS